MGWLKRKLLKGGGVEAAAVEVAGGVASKIIDSVKDLGLSHLGKKELRLQLETLTAEALATESQAFREFFLAYEGAAADQTKFVQILRGLVRPVLTLFLVGAWSWLAYRFLSVPIDQSESFMLIMRQAFYFNLVTMGFWFGDRMIQRTGLIDIFKTNNK